MSKGLAHNGREHKIIT